MPRAFVRHVQAKPFTVQRGELVDERHRPAAAAAVMQRVVDAARARLACDRADRRDADAARDQDRAGGVPVEPEVVARPANLHAHAGPQPLVQPCGAAAARRLAQHRDLVYAALGRIAAQRVLSGEPGVAAFNVDMRARAPARQRRAVGRDEAYAQHALGHRHHAVDAQRAPRAARANPQAMPTGRSSEPFGEMLKCPLLSNPAR